MSLFIGAEFVIVSVWLNGIIFNKHKLQDKKHCYLESKHLQNKDGGMRSNKIKNKTANIL